MNKHGTVKSVKCQKRIVPGKGEVYQIVVWKEKGPYSGINIIRYKTIEEIEAYLNYMPENVEDMEHLIKEEWNSGHKMEI